MKLPQCWGAWLGTLTGPTGLIAQTQPFDDAMKRLILLLTALSLVVTIALTTRNLFRKRKQ